MPLDGSPSPTQEVIERVASAFDIPAEQIISQRRDRPTVRARWACYVIMRDRLNMTFGKIGRIFDGQDHTTVRYGFHEAAVLMADDEDYRQRITAAGHDAAPRIQPAAAEQVAATLDYIVLDRLMTKARAELAASLRNNPAAFRAKYAKTYQRIREAVA